MTSEQIVQDSSNADVYGPSYAGFVACAKWLQEIAYQLAVMNERNADPSKALNVGLCQTNDIIPIAIRKD